MMQFATEKLHEALEEIQPLMVNHHAEVALYKEQVPLAPDWNRYEQAERDQALLLHTARVDGKLVGYAGWLLHWMLHYKHTLAAMNDVLYLAPEHRRGLAGVRLIKYSEAQLKAAGVDRILWHVKTDHDWSPILHRLGYSTEEHILGKILEH